MAARVNEVGDALVAAILAIWPDGADAPNAVERTYLVPTDLNTLTGRKVWVTPVAFEDENASRDENLGKYSHAIVIAERYEPGGVPPRAWMDERVEFVQAVYDLVGSYGNRRASGWLEAGTPARRLWTDRAAVPTVYDWQTMNSDHGFWAEMEVEHREVR